MTIEELTKQNEELAKRLDKATKCYKEVKSQLDAKDTEIESLREQLSEQLGAANSSQSTTDNAELETLKQRVKELEDEIAINGNASEDIAKLQERLENAKRIFAEQKASIKERDTEIASCKATIADTNDALNKTIEEKEELQRTFDNYKASVREAITNLANTL